MKKKKYVLIVGLLLLFCFIQLKANDKITANYYSNCLKPSFSPDDRYIFYWERNNQEIILKEIKLCIYDIKKKTNEILLTRTFKSEPGIVYLEDIDNFFNIGWSPDGKYVAFSIDGRNLEILDYNTKTLVGTLDFIPPGSLGACGYFGIEWIDQNRILVGYVTNKTNLSNTDDAYGVAAKKDDKFIIEEKMVDAKSSLISSFYPYYENRSNKNVFKGYPVFIISEKNKIENLIYKETERVNTWEMLEVPEISSNEYIILEVSRSGKLAIVAKLLSEKNNPNDENLNECKTAISIFKVPQKFQKELASYFEEIFRKL